MVIVGIRTRELFFQGGWLKPKAFFRFFFSRLESQEVLAKQKKVQDKNHKIRTTHWKMFSHLRNSSGNSSANSPANSKNEKAVRVFREPDHEMVKCLIYSNTFEYTKYHTLHRRCVLAVAWSVAYFICFEYNLTTYL